MPGELQQIREVFAGFAWYVHRPQRSLVSLHVAAWRHRVRREQAWPTVVTDFAPHGAAYFSLAANPLCVTLYVVPTTQIRCVRPMHAGVTGLTGIKMSLHAALQTSPYSHYRW